MKVAKRKYLVGSFLIFSILTIENIFSAPLIVNPQHFLKKKERQNIISMKANFAQYTGNTDFIRLNGALIGRIVGGDHLVLALAEGTYGRKDEERYIRRNMQHIRYLYDVSDWMGIESFAQNQFDEFRRIDIRALGGIGPRFTIVLKGIFEFSTGSSYLFEYNRNNTAYFTDANNNNQPYSDSREITRENRWSNYFHLDLQFGKIFCFVSTTYWQPRFDNFNDYRLFSNNLLEIKLKPFLNFFISGAIVYDSRPPESVIRRDTVFKSGIQFTIKEEKKS